MSRVVHPCFETRIAEACFVDPMIQKAEFLRHRDHQRESVLCDGDIDPSAQRFDLDAAFCTGLEIDIAGVGPELLDDLEIGRRVDLFAADAKAFDDHAVRLVEGGPKGFLVAKHAVFRRIEIGDRRPDLRDPVVEPGNVDVIVVLDGGVTFGVRIGIQDYLGRADNDVVFRDNGGHRSLQRGLIVCVRE